MLYGAFGGNQSASGLRNIPKIDATYSWTHAVHPLKSGITQFEPQHSITNCMLSQRKLPENRTTR